MNIPSFQLEFYRPKVEEISTKEQLLNDMGEYLHKRGYVKNTFAKAVIEREKIFPTGLKTLDINVAIPHTDAEHVIKPAVLISILPKPISFNLMGESEKEIPVNIVFMLALDNPYNQLLLLQQLMNLFQKEGSLKAILQASDFEESKKLLEKELVNF
ncbi:PTS sugar transporter subunit IIA [Thermoanaerobacterium sp. DL9XJH110]|uniref:PTS sugar transporter subunit IIA n=1 Tax=Thermoanaerobacterium sp. DL9XJH110 TaxID=3386643 RepID=UPI003BB69739